MFICIPLSYYDHNAALEMHLYISGHKCKCYSYLDINFAETVKFNYWKKTGNVHFKLTPQTCAVDHILF